MRGWLLQRTELLSGARGRAIAGWLAVFCVLAWFQGDAVWTSVRHAANLERINGDSQQQIYPFFRYVESPAFADDYMADYYLACYPLGYWGLYATTASLGIDPTVVSHILPHLQWFIAVLCIGAVAYKLGGKLTALSAMALVLGSSEFMRRIAGGLPRGFGFPILAGTLVALAYARVWWGAACVLLGALFYPVTAVISGLSLAGMLLAPKVSGLSACAWSWTRRLGFLAGTALLTIAIMVPTFISSGRYGEVVRPADVHQFPEAGKGGRYDSASRPPFSGFLASAPAILDDTLLSPSSPWSTTARGWLVEGKTESKTETYSALMDVLFILVLLGWTSLLARGPVARRVLVLGLASGVGYTLARFAAPYAYLPNRYVAYSVPLLGTLALSTAIVGLFPPSFDAGSRRWVKTLLVGAYVAMLLFFFGQNVTPNVGLHLDLSRKEPLFERIAKLPPDAVVAGWPIGPMDQIPYATRRRAFITKEVHQAFHKKYIEEMRRRMRGLIDAYFATSSEPIIRLREEFGVTHLLIARSHFGAKPPTYFKPFDGWIVARRAAARGKSFELPRQIAAAGIFSYKDFVLLDLERIVSPSGPDAAPASDEQRRREQ